MSDRGSSGSESADGPATTAELTSPERSVEVPTALQPPGGLELPDLMDDPVQRQRQAALRARLFGQAARTGQFGRYRLQERLGAGATGVVHVAHDPVLDRRIALKILRDPGGRERDRLLREARALARVSHPNVVEVFEVGEVAREGSSASEAFIALELVDGVTLRAWARSRAWSWPDVVRTYAQAGRGLAAAHAHGLVHRDFKPDNAMVGRDGRVRVLDFGLARGASHGMETTDGDGHGPLDATLTRSGALAGTPAYMAPELFQGQAADARSDQFALAVSVYEALYGERPYAGDTIPELIDRVLADERRPRPRSVTLPRALDAVVERGLARDPAARWPDVRAFVDALEGVVRRTRRRRRGAWLGLFVVASAALALALWPKTPAGVACRPGPERMVGVWDEPRRAALLERWRGPDGALPPSVDAITNTLDERAAAWADAWTQVCEGLRAEEASDAAGHDQALALDERARCLEQRRDEIDGLVQSLEAVPATALRRALPLVEALPRDACTAEAGFPLPPEPDRAAAAAATLAKLRRVGNRCTLEGPRACGPELDAALAEARALEHPPLLAFALQQSAALEDMRAEQETAEVRFEEAFFLARGSGLDELAAKIAINLVDLVGYRGGRHEEGEGWARQAEAMLASVPPDAPLRVDFLNNRGLMRMSAGRTADAERDYLAALEIHGRTPDVPPKRIAPVYTNLAQVAYERHDMERSIELLDRALAIYEETYGVDHPETMTVLNNRGLVQMDRGRLDEAEADLRRVIEIGERNFGPDHPEIVSALSNFARVYMRRGNARSAKAAFERADAILARRLDADHPRRVELANALDGLHVLAPSLRTPAPESAAVSPPSPPAPP